MDERKLRWLCRRGMKELDVLLTRYLDARWPEAGERERAAFAQLLELQDPELWALLTESDRGARERAPLQRDLEDVVERIRNLPGA